MMDTEMGHPRCDECSLGCNIKSQGEFGWCDKTGGKLYMSGGCEDAFTQKTQQKKSGERKTGRAYRRVQAKHKDKRRRKIISYHWYPPAGYLRHDWINGEWVENGTHICYPKSSNAQRFLKPRNNKAVRRYKGEIPSGNSYRKLFEYWYDLY